MSGFTTVLTLLSGIALFLFGMTQMGDGLKRVAGDKLELILYRMTSSPIKGILLGAAVTSVIQSSSATTVMVVGFVNSGMMKVAQAIGIIMGAQIGTSITGWILCLSYIDGSNGIAQLLSTATISAAVAVIGIILRVFVKKQAYRDLGDILMGFAILMVGLQTMSGAVSPLKSNETFVSAFTMFSHNPVMGIVVGILFTAILQSASASIGILQALSTTGSITFATAFPIILGIGIGAACPVLLSSIGTNKNGKRTAIVYLLDDLCGMLTWSIIFYSLNAVLHFDFMDMVMSPIHIAMVNTIYRTAIVCVLAPFIKYMEKLVFTIVKDTAEDLEDAADFELLEPRFLAYPPLAIEQSNMAINGMAKKTRKNIYRAMNLLTDYSEDKFKKVWDKENVIDKYEAKLGDFLMQLMAKPLNEQQSKKVSKFLHTIGDFERISDHAASISIVAQKLNDQQMSFSEDGDFELDVLEDAVHEIVDMTTDAFMAEDLTAVVKVEALRQWIGVMCDDLKLQHINRLSSGKCNFEQGFAFNDLLTNYERIAAHCSNVAVAMIELDTPNMTARKYIRNIKEFQNDVYNSHLEAYAQKYDIHREKQVKKSKKKAAQKALAGKGEKTKD